MKRCIRCNIKCDIDSHECPTGVVGYIQTNEVLRLVCDVEKIKQLETERNFWRATMYSIRHRLLQEPFCRAGCETCGAMLRDLLAITEEAVELDHE